jgi:hypothetical protein
MKTSRERFAYVDEVRNQRNTNDRFSQTLLSLVFSWNWPL